MESLNQAIRNSSLMRGSDLTLRICPKCNEEIEKVVFLEAFKRSVKVPKVCSCKRQALKEKEIQKENQEKMTRLNQIITNSLIDSKFRSCNFNTWDFNKGDKKMYNLASKYAKNFKEMKKEGLGLLIYGDPGNGKTHTVSCIANELINNLTPAICVSINALLDRIKNTYNSWGKEGEETILRGLANADLLIIDDLGTENVTEWSVSRIYNIIDSRYRAGLPLIITTNKSTEDLEDLYGKRTIDRVLEMCTPIENKGASIRRTQAKSNTDKLRKLLV